MVDRFCLSPEVELAIARNQAVVALESSIICQGMPFPQNLSTAREVESAVRVEGAVPATIAIVGGVIRVGLGDQDLEFLATSKATEKVSIANMAAVLGRKATGGTTVSATMRIASKVGIQVFATGGIGGVHRGGENTLDISADLTELSRTPVLVVSSGVKAILDMGKTLEVLETLGVPVLGYRTDELPAFYSVSSGLKIGDRIEDPAQAAAIFRFQQELGGAGALLFQPVPKEVEIPAEVMESYIQLALAECQARGIVGKAVTPYLLGEIAAKTGGQSLRANIALVIKNSRLAAKVAVALAATPK